MSLWVTAPIEPRMCRGGSFPAIIRVEDVALDDGSSTAPPGEPRMCRGGPFPAIIRKLCRFRGKHCRLDENTSEGSTRTASEIYIFRQGILPSQPPGI